MFDEMKEREIEITLIGFLPAVPDESDEDFLDYAKEEGFWEYVPNFEILGIKLLD